MGKVIILKSNKVYIKKQVDKKSVNLFGAPIPKKWLREYYSYFARYLK
tara:strand:- start:864 stop:1007 length:144 start_codon:yes stop_codon:yes gene_type:complete